MRETSKVTLKTLAAELGFSTSTVSRVLNSPEGEAHRWASPENVRKIVAYAEEREYAPNPHAASLRTSRSGMIGVVVPRLQDYVLAAIYEGVESAANRHGYFTVVTNTLDEPQLHEERLQRLLDRRVDGLIVANAQFENPMVDVLDMGGVPYALTNRRSPGLPSVTCDDYRGGQLVAKHLLSSGRKTFWILGGDPRMSTSRDRVEGFLSTVSRSGCNVPTENITYDGFDTHAGANGVVKLSNRSRFPDAIFAANDFAALGAIGVLRNRSIRVPDDIAVVGYNDTPLAEASGLTTVHSPLDEMGRDAIGLLVEIIDGRSSMEARYLAPTLMVRDTA